MILTGSEDLRVRRTIDSIKSVFEQMICEMDYGKIRVPQLSRRNIESNMPIVELLKEFANNKKVLTAETVRTHCF